VRERERERKRDRDRQTKIDVNTRRPHFEDSRDYEDSGLDRAPNTTEFVHVSDWVLALWIPRMKYVVTSRPSLLLPLTSAMPHLPSPSIKYSKVLH
jgi:hypothetical protein